MDAIDSVKKVVPTILNVLLTESLGQSWLHSVGPCSGSGRGLWSLRERLLLSERQQYQTVSIPISTDGSPTSD